MTAPTITDRRVWDSTKENRVTVGVRREDAPDVLRVIAWARPAPGSTGAWEVRVLVGEHKGVHRAADKLSAKRLLADYTRKVAH